MRPLTLELSPHKQFVRVVLYQEVLTAWCASAHTKSWEAEDFEIAHHLQ